MSEPRPRCPLCAGLMRRAGDQAAGGHVVEWRCVAQGCTGIVQVEAVRPGLVAPRAEAQGEEPATWGDAYLGAPVEELMRAPVTPQGGSSGGGRRRQQPKAGEVQAQRERRQERRSYDQAPLVGGRDREVTVEQCTRQVNLPLASMSAAWLEDAARRAGMSRQDLLRRLLGAAQEAPWCGLCDMPGLPGGGCLGGCKPEGVDTSLEKS